MPAAESKTAGKKSRPPAQKQPSGEHDKERNESARESTPESNDLESNDDSPKTENFGPTDNSGPLSKMGHAYNLRHLPSLHLLRFLRLFVEYPHHAALQKIVAAANELRHFVAGPLLCRAWKRTHEIRGALVESGKLAVILVANLGKGGDCPSAEVQQKHIHTTVHHAGRRAAFLIANEYGWGSHKMGKEGPGGTDKRVQTKLGFKLTTEKAKCERCDQMRCKCGLSSCWRYALGMRRRQMCSMGVRSHKHPRRGRRR